MNNHDYVSRLSFILLYQIKKILSQNKSKAVEYILKYKYFIFSLKRGVLLVLTFLVLLKILQGFYTNSVDVLLLQQ